MKLITVRHGESVSNDAGVTAGWADVELNENGLEQAKKVADRLKNEDVDVIYSSDLKRASRTAEEIAKLHDCELILDKRLREQDKGKYEQGPAKKMWDGFGASGEDILEWTPKDGESAGTVKGRVMEFLNEIRGRHQDKTVLIVSHGVVLAVLSRTFCNETDFDGDIKKEEWKKHKHKNSSVSKYTFSDGKWKVVRLNCTEHLE